MIIFNCLWSICAITYTYKTKKQKSIPKIASQLSKYTFSITDPSFFLQTTNHPLLLLVLTISLSYLHDIYELCIAAPDGVVFLEKVK